MPSISVYPSDIGEPAVALLTLNLTLSSCFLFPVFQVQVGRIHDTPVQTLRHASLGPKARSDRNQTQRKMQNVPNAHYNIAQILPKSNNYRNTVYS